MHAGFLDHPPICSAMANRDQKPGLLWSDILEPAPNPRVCGEATPKSALTCQALAGPAS